jgi:hypothetical protein
MTNEAQLLIDGLTGRAWEIAATVQREIEAAAPYAELDLALGVPTWSFHERVVSLLPFTAHCSLHFWRGDQLERLVPGRLSGNAPGPIRILELRSMTEVDEGVRALLRGAFRRQIETVAEADLGRSRNAALQF